MARAKSVRRTARKSLKIKVKTQKDILKEALATSSEALTCVKRKIKKDLKAEHRLAMLNTGAPLTSDIIAAYSSDYKQDKLNTHRENTLSALPLSYCCESRKFLQTVNYSYSHSLERVPLATSQAHSGRCWLFAALNSMRYYLMRELHLPDDFELSEAYLFFYDKIEKANCFLEKIILNRNADTNDPRLAKIMSGPVDDGGLWSFVSNLIKKYGIVPKTIYAESFNSSVTDEMNQVLTDKLAQFANDIRLNKAKSDQHLRSMVLQQMLPVIYQILSNFMGEPPGSDTEFSWEYHEVGEHAQQVRHKGTYHLVKGLTPIKFYKTYIEGHYDVSEMVLLRNDPRSTSVYMQVYTGELQSNMVGGQPELAFNLSMEDIKAITAKTVINGHPVWFGCEVQRDFNPYYGLLAVEGYDYDSMLGLKMDQTKEESILTRNGGPSHAMAIVGLNVTKETENGPVVDKWKIENSWGEFNIGDPGYLQMTDTWFDRYGYEVVVPIDMLPDNLRDIYEECRARPIVLPFTDPLA